MNMTDTLETLPFEIKNIIASRARMGLIALATDHVIEYELPRLISSNFWDTDLYNPRTNGANSDTPDASWHESTSD